MILSRMRFIVFIVAVFFCVSFVHVHGFTSSPPPKYVSLCQSQHAHDIPSTSLHMAKGRRGGLDIDPSSNESKPRPIGDTNQSTPSTDEPTTKKTIKGNWYPVSGLTSISSLPKEEATVKLMDTLVPSLINKQTNPTGAVSIVNYKGTTYCFSSSCASCKIPLTKAKILEPSDETGGDARLQCDFCGATYNLRTGERLKQAGGKLLGFLFSKQESESLPVYALGEKGGEVFISVP